MLMLRVLLWMWIMCWNLWFGRLLSWWLIVVDELVGGC